MTTTKALPVRLPGEMIDRIDKLRGDLIPRDRYVRHILEKALKAEERRTAKAAKR